MTVDHATTHASMLALTWMALVHFLPTLAVLVPLAYYCVVLYETKTVQSLVTKIRTLFKKKS